MTTYIVMGREKIEASSPEEFLKKMHKSAHTPSPSDQEFMVDVARRCKLQTGDVISSSNAADFLADLVAADYVVEEN